MGRNYDYEEGEERAFCQQLTKWATSINVEVITIKLNLKGRRGWPDRLLLWNGGNLVFIEFKRKGEVPRKLQLLIHETLRKLGFQVEVFDDRHDALDHIQAQIRATTFTDRRNEIRSNDERVPSVPKTRPREDSGNSEGI